MNIQVPPGCVFLAQHDEVLVYGDQDDVYVKHSDGRDWQIGWMYGNPVAALVTWDGRYGVVVGCGVMVFDLWRFTEDTNDSSDKPHVTHRFAEPDDIWWFALVEQVLQNEECYVLRLATDLTDKHVGIYSLSLPDFEFTPVPHHQPMP